jgi:hypothetical protein
MLDDWLERLTREPPATRAKRQLRDLRLNTRTTLTQLDQHPHDQLTQHILHDHTQREQAILRRGMKPPPKRCQICGTVLPAPSDLWTNNRGIKLLWAAVIAFLVVFLFQFIGWWVLWVLPIGWLVSQPFFWTVTVPFAMLVVVWLILVPTGMLT